MSNELLKEESALVSRSCEEGGLPVSAYKSFLDAREAQMRLILHCYMENADLVARLRLLAPEDDMDGCAVVSKDFMQMQFPQVDDNLYDYFVGYIREIEEDDSQLYGPGYYSLYGTRQSSRRSIIVDLMRLSRKFKIKVNAPSLKTVGNAGKP